MAKKPGLTPIGELLPEVLKPEVKPLTPIQERLASMPISPEEIEIVFQHSVLCQTCMP